MKVELLTSPESLAEMESNAALAALTCRGNADKEHEPSEVLGRILKAGHERVLEHITLTYGVDGISRALLQEVARHRHISLSVESTRHTLRKKFDAVSASLPREYSEYMFVLCSKLQAKPDVPNDELKYYLPEFWPTSLVLTVNIRELRHILNLRTAPAALKEFRCLGHALFDAVPDGFKYLLGDCVHEEVEEHMREQADGMVKRGRKPKPENADRVQVSVYLPRSTYEGVKDLARWTQRTMSDVLSDLASEFVEQNADKLSVIRNFLMEVKGSHD